MSSVETQVIFLDGSQASGLLTTESSASSNGQPILMIDGEPYSIIDCIIRGISVKPVDHHLYVMWRAQFAEE